MLHTIYYMSEEIRWYRAPVDEIFTVLQSNMEGISQEEAVLRLERFGFNEVEIKKKRGPVYQFLKQFASPLIYILIAAAVLTFFLGEYTDMTVIVVVILANALIGFVQERKAEHALDSLAKMLVPDAHVLRDGQRRVIPGRELVVGDVVLLETGDRVPADIRLFYAKNLRADESILTGESVTVEKKNDIIQGDDIPLADQKNMSFAGTLITQGMGRGIVVATARFTEIGKISGFIEESEEMATPLVKKMASFGMQLSIVILLVSVFTFFVGLQKGFETVQMFMASVSLAVAAIPEGLPAVITVSLAMGVKTMASKNAIVRTMPAVETLGSATVICSDKTGTLTKNQMTVTRIYTSGKMYMVSGVGYVPEGKFILCDRIVDPKLDHVLVESLKAGSLCNNAALRGESIDGDPTEGALLISALKAGKFYLPRLDVIPFESEKRFMATLHIDQDGGRIIYVKGSPEKIVQLCSSQMAGTDLQPLDAQGINRAAEQMASLGLRVIGTAHRKVDNDMQSIESADIHDLVFSGLQGMIDPPRREVMEAIKKCRTAGIRVIMITGDHLLTALTIARHLGIQTQGALSGNDIDKMTEPELQDALGKVSVYARTSPENKYRIVKQLQAGGEVVAVTGDGLNDAPALKIADIGIAMGISGTEVAKEASDMVLADDNFASIVAAVEEGRDVYSKIQKIILWALPTSIGEALAVLAAVLFIDTLPLLPIHILWINTVTAVGLGVSITVEPKDKGLLEQNPRPKGEPLLLPLIKRRIAIVSIMMVTAAFLLFFYEVQSGRSEDTARTMAMNTIVCFEIFYLFNSKSMNDYVLPKIFSNKFMLLGTAFVIGLQMIITYSEPMNIVFKTAPQSVADWILIILISSTVFIAVEFDKYFQKTRNSGSKHK